MLYPDTLTIFLNTRIRGYSKIKYEPEMTVPKTKFENVRFTPIYKLSSSSVKDIPSGYSKSEKYTQFFSKGEYQSLINRSIADIPQKMQTITQSSEDGTIDNNIRITLNTLFGSNNIFYIKDKPYTIYSYEWTTGDWIVDKKSFEKQVLSPFYRQSFGLMRQNLLLNKSADEELAKFEKENPKAVKGKNAFSKVSSFNRLIPAPNPSRVMNEETREIIGKKVNEYVKENVSPIFQKLISETISSDEFLNPGNTLDLATNPIIESLFYSDDFGYSKDVEKFKSDLSSFYTDYKAAQGNFGKIMKKLNEETGKFSTEDESILEADPKVKKHNLLKKIKIYGELSENLTKMVELRRTEDIGRIESNVNSATQILEDSKLEFFDHYLEVLKLLLQKIETEKNYIICRIKFFRKLYEVKSYFFNKNATTRYYQNQVYLDVLDSDIYSYSMLLNNMVDSTGTLFPIMLDIKK